MAALLLNVNYMDDTLHTYFVPDESVLPANLLTAIKKMHGVFCNSDEFTKSFYKAWAYMSAAMTTKRHAQHLSQDNEYNENRFAHLLEQFRIDEDPAARMTFAIEGGEIHIVQTGCY